MNCNPKSRQDTSFLFQLGREGRQERAGERIKSALEMLDIKDPTI